MPHNFLLVLPPYLPQTGLKVKSKTQPPEFRLPLMQPRTTRHLVVCPKPVPQI